MSRILRGADWARALLDAVEGGDVSAWMERATRVIKSDRHSRVGLLTLRGQACHLKQYRPKGPLQGLQFRLGRGRGVASFDSARLLDRAGLAIAEPLACVLVGGDMLLLSRAIEEGRDLKTLWLQGQAEATLVTLFARAAVALAALHGAGYCHGDCKWSNFLVAADAVYLVDLEAVERGPVTGPGCSRDLARFTVNAEDMGLEPDIYSQFLARYAAELGLSVDATVRRILPRVEALRRRHLEKYGQRGHRLV